MHKPITPTKSQSPYNSGKKNPDYINPTFVSQAVFQDNQSQNKALQHGHTKQNNCYYTYYNQSQKIQIEKTQGTIEKQRYGNILKFEEKRFETNEKNYFIDRKKQLSQHELTPDYSLNRIKRNSQIELNMSWNNGVQDHQIKQDIKKDEKRKLYTEIEQTEQFYSSVKEINQSVKDFKAQSYLRGLQLQNRHNQYLKEVEKTKKLEEEIIRSQELKIQELRRQQEQLSIAKSKFTK
ncbi:unnamed protein product [Paramecium primaurelia]|uniref:Uncharacterized protein n=1 Tax=Paramecium primaurelia TaxID=5886 RepID=A0A8S1K4L5_PARPR|nr:unnamed protein product [Paramecium primaurelia]